jgi:hypothetical protein
MTSPPPESARSPCHHHRSPTIAVDPYSPPSPPRSPPSSPSPSPSHGERHRILITSIVEGFIRRDHGIMLHDADIVSFFDSAGSCIGSKMWNSDLSLKHGSNLRDFGFLIQIGPVCYRDVATSDRVSRHARACEVVRSSQSMAVQVRSFYGLGREGVTSSRPAHFPSSPLSFNPRSRRFGRVVFVPISSPPRSSH